MTYSKTSPLNLFILNCNGVALKIYFDFVMLKIPVTTRGFQLQISYIRISYLPNFRPYGIVG